VDRQKEVSMADGVSPKPPGRVRGRPFERGRSGNPAGRRTGSCNKTTEAAAALLAGESEALTRKAVELALVGDPTAMRLCLERILPACRERAVKFALPPIESAADIAAAMKAVTSALADGTITPGEAATIAAVVDTFVRAIETSDFDRRLTLMEDDSARRASAEASVGPGDALQLLGEVLLLICCRCSNEQSTMQGLVADQRSARRQARAAASRIAPVSMW
jgi:hypothetical protein